MQRQTLLFLATGLVGAVIGAVGAGLLLPKPAGISADEVRAIVSEMQQAQPAGDMAALDPETLNPLIEKFLMSEPEVLQRVSDALDTKLRSEAAEQARTTLATYSERIYDDPANVVLGNPEGDVTLVELFDYNCGYCRNAVPDMATLLAEDPNLKIILKEFPILSKESVDAARIAVVVNRSEADYWAFHSDLFSTRGKITAEAAMAAAEKLGLNPVDVQLQAQGQDVTGVIQRSYEIAQALNISGTPTYIIGDEVIPGAIGLDELKTRIANMRACGKTACDG